MEWEDVRVGDTLWLTHLDGDAEMTVEIVRVEGSIIYTEPVPAAPHSSQ